jgi:hypothetical protein
MPKYRKKPVVIDAFRMGIDPRPDWFQDKVSTNEIITHAWRESFSPFDHSTTWCEIKTLEGTMRGDYGDYIIQGVNGEVYPCKPDIFEKTHELADLTPPVQPDITQRAGKYFIVSVKDEGFHLQSDEGEEVHYILIDINGRMEGYSDDLKEIESIYGRVTRIPGEVITDDQC